MNTLDNIAAPATAVGGAVNIIRLSGPGVLDIANKIWQGTPLSGKNARKMLLGKVSGDQALAVYMKSPASYTGDDVVEFQCHGGAAVADAVLRAVLSAGCRLAEPGEFTCRAFVNGKIDLLQAEAVSDIITSGSNAALKMAEKQLDGVLSRQINDLCAELDFLRSECEARLDFPDEELDFDDQAAVRIGEVKARFCATGCKLLWQAAPMPENPVCSTNCSDLNGRSSAISREQRATRCRNRPYCGIFRCI